MNKQEIIDEAKMLGAAGLNNILWTSHPFTSDDMQIVLFNKTLLNWKAVVTTDLASEYLLEVIHNGSKDENEVGVYRKEKNICFK